MKIFLISGFLGLNTYDYLEKYLEGFNYYIAKINGHTNYNQIPPFQNWILEVDSQFQREVGKEEVFLIGFSMGAIIASFLNAKYKSQIKGIVMISPAFYHKYFNKFDLDLVKEFKLPKKVNTFKNRKVIYGLKELKKLSNHALRYNWLKYISCPILIIVGNNDGLINKQSIDLIFKDINSEKRFYKVIDSKHNVFNSNHKDYVCRIIVSFLNKFDI